MTTSVYVARFLGVDTGAISPATVGTIVGGDTALDTADGDTSIRWTTANLPILTTATCTLNADGSSYTASIVEETGLAVGTSGVRLRTRSGGTLTNIRSTVVLY